MKNAQKHTSNLWTNIGMIAGLCMLVALAANSQQLQKGVSVELAPTHNAKAYPAADELNAWVVTVSEDGRIWFGTEPVTVDALAEAMTRMPRGRDQNLYIKADARVPFAGVQSVLKAAHTVEFETPVFLTGQSTATRPGMMESPKGLEVSIASGAQTGPKPAELEVGSVGGGAELKVNGQSATWASLQSALRAAFSGTENVVRLKADENVPFADVARAIDISRSTGAKVVITMPTV